MKNSIFFGDCLQVMKAIPEKSINLIYLDPPFFTQRKHSQKNRNRTREFSFSDSWESLDAYLQFMRERLELCRSLLSDDGSIFLHCDVSANHHLRLVLDEVMGKDNFQSEIIWSYKRWSNSAKGLMPNHQTIFFYSKSSNFKFNKIYGEYSETTNVDQILQLRERDPDGFTTYAKSESGETLYANSKLGVALGDVWEIPFLNPKAKERIGYPTQKPIHLLERIINLVTEKGDVVLDPFMGSGTTLVAAKLLDRNYLGIDVSKDAVDLANNRIENPIRTDSYLLKLGREAYRNSDEESLAHLLGLELNIVQRNKGIDAFLKDSSFDGIFPVKVQKPTETFDESINSLVKASQGKNFKHGYLVRTHLDNTFFLDLEIPKWITVIDSVKVQILNSFNNSVLQS